MSESEQQWNDSPLLSERGTTNISGTVVSSIAGMAAQEVDGVHMGGGASRTAGGVLGSITGSDSRTRGISVEVGRTETAIDLKMGIEYNKNILQTVEEVRRRITDRVQSMTGLQITELNATITDITFPEKEQRRRLGSGSGTRALGEGPTSETASDTQTTPTSEPRPGASEETTQVEPRTESASEPVPEEEGRPPEADETAELRTGDSETEEQPTSVESETRASSETRSQTETPEEPETRAEAEASEETEAEARRRRRAEERARRRRRTEDS